MHVDDVPESRLVGQGYTQAALEQALGQIFGDKPVRYGLLLRGAPFSARIFSAEKLDLENSRPFPPLSPGEIAAELVRYIEQARYPPTKEESLPFSVRGWEIRTGSLGDIKVAIAMAARIPVASATSSFNDPP